MAQPVYFAEDYIYSSASNYTGIDQLIQIDCLFFSAIGFCFERDAKNKRSSSERQ